MTGWRSLLVTAILVTVLGSGLTGVHAATLFSSGFETQSGGADAPSTPSQFTANAESSSEIALAWQASQDDVGVAGYRLYRDGQRIRELDATQFLDSGLAAGTAYTYAVEAFDATDNVSDRAFASTNTPASDGGSGSVRISWQASPVADVQGYYVYHGTRSTSYDGRTWVDDATEAVMEVGASGTHYFAVTAVDVGGNESRFSREVTVSL